MTRAEPAADATDVEWRPLYVSTILGGAAPSNACIDGALDRLALSL